ncbi:hypothetical protein BD779DRAFT_1674269 [Infundibulicybe gibba]|nr:hypothetical protein BD779DRAFT_1674269 [Infundibulicybe gibba]
MAYQVSLCLQNIAEDDILPTARIRSTPNAAVIESFPTLSPAVKGTIAVEYLRNFPAIMSFDQNFTVLRRLIHTLNASDHKVPSLEGLDFLLDQLSSRAGGCPTLVERVDEVIWQRAILFWNLLSAERWAGPTKIHWEVQNVFENLETFTDDDLDFIFNTLQESTDWDSQDASVLTWCWVKLTSQLKPHVLQDRPPVRNFMAFLDSRFQMGKGVEYLCDRWWYDDKKCDSFFEALHAWIERNEPDTQSFIRCWEKLTTALDSHSLRGTYWHKKSFRHFEVFLEKRIARNNNTVEQVPVHNP